MSDQAVPTPPNPLVAISNAVRLLAIYREANYMGDSTKTNLIDNTDRCIADLEAALPSVASALTLRQAGAGSIAAERQRQVDVEGWTPEHDASHSRDASLARAAICYADHAARQVVPDSIAEASGRFRPSWPWDRACWKPSDDPIRNLVKAGALIAAEIDRLRAIVERTPL